MVETGMVQSSFSQQVLHILASSEGQVALPERPVKWGTMVLMYVFCRSQMEFVIMLSSSVLSYEFDICVRSI